MSNPNNHMGSSENDDGISESWEALTNETAEQKQADIRESVQLKQELNRFYKEFDRIFKEYDGNLPTDISKTLNERYDQIYRAMRDAQIKETQALIPESQREAFKEYADDESSIITIDDITDGIYRYYHGEKLEDIEERFLNKDWSGKDEESNKARGMYVYNRMIGFLDIDK